MNTMETEFIDIIVYDHFIEFNVDELIYIKHIKKGVSVLN